MFFCHRDIFNDNRLNPTHKTVRINFFDKELYRQTNFSNRVGKCYIIRKGENRTDLPDTSDGIVVDSLSEPEKVKVFNHCEYCYCYDTQTFYASIASICGCKTIVMPEPGKTRADYRGTDDNPHYGIAYGNSKKELEWAEKTREKLIDSVNYDKSNTINAQKLINYINEYFIRPYKCH